VWDGFWEEEEPPSPKFQEYEYGAVPPLADPVKLTVNGASPDVVEAEAEAESSDVGGGCESDAVILVESVSLLAALSVTVRVAV